MHCCKEMSDHLVRKKIAILYIPKFREYGIKNLSRGLAFQLINYCPWCGRKLPESLREEWFEILGKSDLEPDSPNIHAEYLTDELWKKN